MTNCCLLRVLYTQHVVILCSAQHVCLQLLQQSAVLQWFIGEQMQRLRLFHT